MKELQSQQLVSGVESVTARESCEWSDLEVSLTIGLIGHLGTLLAHIQLAVNQQPQVPFR